MKAKTIIGVVAAWALTATVAQAAHLWEDSGAWWDSHFTSDPNAQKYSANELSLDLFGSYNNPEGKFTDLFETNIRRGNWGGGAGLSYFLTRNLGLGADFNMSSKTEGNLVDDVVGDLYLRLPLGNSGLAPYLVGSGGRGMYPVYSWLYGGGVGLEMRFNPTTAIFSDARFLWSDRATEFNRLIIRVGLRLVF